MHPTDFLIDLDVANDSDVAFPRTLDVGINTGNQVLPAQDDPGLIANRLEIFTGTAVPLKKGDRDEPRRGVVRIRLHFKLTESVQYVGSASVAALATIVANEDNVMVGADAAEIVTDPTAPAPDGTPTLPANGLPSGELYLLIDAVVQSEKATINRIAYQANVLIKDSTPDLDSFLVRSRPTDQFTNVAQVIPGQDWEYQITLTGPVLDPNGFTIQLSSDSNDQVPICPGTPPPPQPCSITLAQGQTSGVFRAQPTSTLARVVALLTAVGTRVTKTATIIAAGPR